MTHTVRGSLQRRAEKEKIEGLFLRVKEDLKEEEIEVLNAYHPELCSKHRVRVSMKKQYSLKMRDQNPVSESAVLMNDSEFLVFFFSICTAINEALTHNFHVLKYLKEIEKRVERLKEQYHEVGKAVERLNGMDSRFVAGIEECEESYWKIYRKNEECMNLSFVFDDRFERDLKSSGRDRNIEMRGPLKYNEPPSVINEENTFLEEDESNRENELEESKISIMNRTEYEEGKRLI